jgi:hypothetical protein
MNSCALACATSRRDGVVQWGDLGTAGAEKYNLEEMQRAERRVRLRTMCRQMRIACLGPLNLRTGKAAHSRFLFAHSLWLCGQGQGC